MINIISKYIISGALVLCFFVHAEEVVNNDKVIKIPYELKTEGYESDIIISEDKLSIVAKKGSDLYTNSNASSSKDNAPRVFFVPKSDFIFSAKVTANFTTSYDGGALFLYADRGNWGKLLFERFKSGNNGIATTLTRSTGDDAYHYLVENNEVYLRIVRKSDTFTFLYSKNGEEWSYLRSFSVVSPKPIKVGFLAQSPISQAHNVVFSNIQFKEY